MKRTLVVLTGILLVACVSSACAVLGRKRLPVMQLIVEIDTSPADREAAIKQTIEIIDKRLDALGVRADVKPQGNPADGRIAVSLWSGSDLKRIKQIIVTNGKLELTHVISNPSPAPCQTYSTKEEAIASILDRRQIPATRRVLPYRDRPETDGESSRPAKWVVVEAPAIIDGSQLRNAEAVPVSVDDKYQIVFSLTKGAAEKFGQWTALSINEYLGVVLNDEVRSIAYIKSRIFDQGEITGNFTKQSAEDLALVLRSGSLPFPVKIVGESFIQSK